MTGDARAHGNISVVPSSVCPGFAFLTLSEVEALPDLEWLVPGILPRPCLAVLYGEPGCGKTFVALSLALTVAMGGEWLGRETVAVPVLYIAAEGALGLKLRIAAHRARCGIEGIAIRVLARAVDILDPAQVEALIVALQGIGFAPGLIVIDTLARVTVGADENNAKDMGRAVAALDSIKTTFNASVLAVHHTRKDGASERGSSALRGAADAMIECARSETLDGPAVALKCSKMKDEEPFKPFIVTLDRVELPEGRSSLVLGRIALTPLDCNGASADRIIALLDAKFAVCGATTSELQKAFTAAGHGSKSTFDRAWRTLKDGPRLRSETQDRRVRYFPLGVSVNEVSS